MLIALLIWLGLSLLLAVVIGRSIRQGMHGDARERSWTLAP